MSSLYFIYYIHIKIFKLAIYRDEDREREEKEKEERRLQRQEIEYKMAIAKEAERAAMPKKPVQKKEDYEVEYIKVGRIKINN
jgi:hypothetical protein